MLDEPYLGLYNHKSAVCPFVYNVIVTRVNCLRTASLQVLYFLTICKCNEGCPSVSPFFWASAKKRTTKMSRSDCRIESTENVFYNSNEWHNIMLILNYVRAVSLESIVITYSWKEVCPQCALLTWGLTFSTRRTASRNDKKVSYLHVDN